MPASAFSSLNYPGRSGYGSGSSGYGSPIIGSPALGRPSTAPDYAVYNPSTGLVIGLKSKQPFNGVDPMSGKTFKAGKEVTPDISTATGVPIPYGGGATVNPNSPERYKPVDIVKDQPIADTTAGLLDTFKKTAADSLRSFDDYLKQFSSGVADSTNQFKSDLADARAKSLAAQNIAPTVAALTARQGQYDTALNTASKNYADLNAADAAQQRALVQKGYDLLPQFDAAGNAIANRQMQEVVKNLSRYKLGTGTPTSLGGDESRILAQGAADVLLPLKQAQIAQRYNLLGNEQGVQRDITGRETTRISQFNPAIAAQQFQSGQATAQTIQGLNERVRQMSADDAIKFMQALSVPLNLQQQILSNAMQYAGAKQSLLSPQLGQLAQLAQLNDLSRYRSLQDVLGVTPSQPQYFGFNAPGYSGPSSRPPPAGGGYTPPGAPRNSLPAPNAPVTIDPRGAAPRYQYDPSAGQYFDADTLQYVEPPDYSRYAGNYQPSQPPVAPVYTGDVNLPEDVYA